MTQAAKNYWYNLIFKSEFDNDTSRCHRFDKLGLNLLHWAVLCNQTGAIRELLDVEQMDINQGTKHTPENHVYNFTPIRLAIEYSDISIFKLLLNKNADIFIPPLKYNKIGHDDYLSYRELSKGKACFEFAKKHKRYDIIRMLEERRLAHYIKERSSDDNIHHYHNRFFNIPIQLGTTELDKVAAAREYKRLLESGSDLTKLENLKKTHPAANNGELGRIYRASIRARRP